MWPFARRVQPSNTVAVFAAKDRASLLLAQSLLDSGGLRYLVISDFAQDIFGIGRIGIGWNLATGPPTIWVSRHNADAAQKVLSDLMDYRPSPIPSFLRALAVALLMMDLLPIIVILSTGF